MDALLQTNRKLDHANFVLMLANAHGGMLIGLIEEAPTRKNTLAVYVVKSFTIISVPIVNIAHRHAFGKDWGKRMTTEFYDSLIKYKSAMAQAKIMLSKGLINSGEYTKIEANMCGRFGINFDCLYRENDLIYSDLYGNIPHTKEVL